MAPTDDGSMMDAWTPGTLKSHLERLIAENDHRYQQRFEAQQEALHDALKAAEKAVNKAEAAMEKRFDGVNEFRQALSDSTMRSLPRSEAESAMKSIADRNDAMVRSLSEKTEVGLTSLRTMSDTIVTRITAMEAGKKMVASVGTMIAMAALGLIIIIGLTNWWASSHLPR